MRLALAGILVILGIIRPASQDVDYRETCFGLEAGLSGMSVHDVRFIRGKCYVTAEKGVYTFDGDRFARAFVFSDPAQRPSLVFAFGDSFAVVDRSSRVFRADGSLTDFLFAGRFDGMPLCLRAGTDREYYFIREGVPIPVRLPPGTLLAATSQQDTVVSDGWQVMRWQAGRALPLHGKGMAQGHAPGATPIFSILASSWVSVQVQDMTPFDGKVYISCRDGRYVYSAQAGFQPWVHDHPLPGPFNLFARDGMLFGATASGVVVFDSGGNPSWSGLTVRRPMVKSMTFHAGSLFIGTIQDGLCVVTPERLRLFTQEGQRGAIGVALWQDTVRAAREPQQDCGDLHRVPEPSDDGYCYFTGEGAHAQSCGRGTVFWDDRGAFAWYDAPSMQYIVADSGNNVYLGASRFVLRIPAEALRARRQAIPDTLRKTKGLTLLKVMGDSVFIGDEGEITIIAGDRQAVLPFPAIRDVVPVGEGMLYLGYGTPSRFVHRGGAAADVAWAHPVLAPAFFNAGFHDGGFTFFTSDEGLYYVRTSLLTACLARGAVVPLARITLAGRSMIEFNGGHSGSAVKYKGDWYLPAINGVVRLRPLVLEDFRTDWRLTLSDGLDTAVTAIPGDEHMWHSPVVDLGIEWDYLPRIGELLMQLSINGVVQYRGGLVRSNRFFLRRGLNRVEVSVFHPQLPDGRQTFTVLIDRRLPLLARIDFWILVAAVILLAGLVAFVYSAQRYRRILRAHQGLLRDKAVLLEAWYANPGHHTAPQQENILRSYMHDIEGGLRVSADTLKLLARPGNPSPDMLLEVARGLEALLEICRRTSMEIIPPVHDSDALPQTVRKIIESAVAHNQGYARAKAVDVVISGDIRLPWKAAPELGRVLYVLVNNAIKFSLPGQVVEVSASVVGHVLNITIADQGRGFRLEGDPNLQPSRIPVSPGTSGEVGSGQGIYLAGRLVDEMGGVLSLAPRRNEPGTIATVTLPVA